MRSLGVAAIALACAAGCGGAPPRVALTEDCSTKPGDFGDLTEAWTRHGALSRDWQQVISVSATFKSPCWRLAHLNRVADRKGLDAEAKAKLVADDQAAQSKTYDVELIVTTWDRKENELSRPNPVWSVTLIDGNGRSIAPAKIARDKRPKHILRAEFPRVGDFAEAYVASFPHDPPVLGAGVKALRLRVASERGSVELAWEAP